MQRAFLLISLWMFCSCVLTGQRVYIDDNMLKVNGQPLYLNGANTPWDHWNDLGTNFDRIWWNSHFADLNAAGINATRVWISCDANHAGLVMGEDGQLQGPTEEFWADMDSLVAIAKRHRVYLMAALMSFDHFKIDQPASGKWVKMLRSRTNVDLFVENYAVALVERYQDNPYLFAIDACNEIIWVSDTENQTANAVPWTDIQYLIGRIAQRVHQTSEVLVCASNYLKYTSTRYGYNKYSDEELFRQTGDTAARVDFYKIHYYSWVSRWFDGFHPLRTPGFFNLDDKPSITGELPANEITAWDAARGEDTWLMSIKDAYEVAFRNGWQGTMAWTSNGVDGNGNLGNNLAAATLAFIEAHYDLVYPDTSSTYLSVSQSILEIPGNDTLTGFSIFSNLPWTVTDDAPWITSPDIQGDGDSLVEVAVQANHTGEARSANIEIHSARGVKTISLSQTHTPAVHAGARIINPHEHAGIRIYPHPVSGPFIIEYRQEKAGWTRLELTDQTGRSLKKVVNYHPSAGTSRICVEDLNVAPGFLFLSIRFQDGTAQSIPVLIQ